jgi:Carboxypeptidase regulatory-like domain
MRFSHVAVAALFVPAALFCQEFRGAISGSVKDPSGAAIAGVKITVNEINTGTKIHTVSDTAGQYTAPYLQPGDYEISADMQSFKKALRQGVTVAADSHIIIDLQLEVGDASQTVSVTAAAPLLNTENASAGSSITHEEVQDLPLNGGTPMALAALSLGVIATGQPGLIHPFDASAAAGWSVGGGYAQTSELLIDGSPDATWDGRLAYSVPKDAVQEVNVKAFDADAAYGHTGGGTLNQVMKTGTNSTAFEQVQPNNLTANNFFNNAKDVARPVTHFNQYGVTAGGPVWIPKVYNGKNKLFWFFAFEGLKDSQPNPVFTTVPTNLERQGNFSGVLAADGSSSQLYDPYSAVLSGATITRTPYPNNVIPTTQLNPIAQAYLKFYPEPNITPVRPDGYENFLSNATTNDNYNNELGRLDYNMSNSSRMFFDIRSTGYDQLKNVYFNNPSEGSLLYRNNLGGTVDEVYTMNATNVLDVRVNFSRLAEIHASPNTGFDPTTLGFPAYIASHAEYLEMPVINFSTNTDFQALSSSSNSNLPSQSLQLYGAWTKIKGKHTLKYGGDVRQYRLNTYTVGNSTGTFSFSGNSYVRASSSASSTVTMGQDFSSFLLGLPYSGSYDLSTYGSWYSYYASPFVQDDWRVKSNLTISVGLRYDWNGPYHEKYGRTVDGFDSSDPNPLQAAAQAAYAKNPISEIPVGAFNVPGGLTFASPGDNDVYHNTSHLFSPRAGFAWTPGVFHGKTVIRGGFGLFTSPVTISNLAITGG